MPLLTTRATIYLGSWNARTMWETERVFQIAAEMRRYNLEVLGISETHWTKVGQQRLASEELLLYSGHDEENVPRTQRVALILSKQTQNALMGWESHGPKIIKASFKTKKEDTSMNVIHAMRLPTNTMKTLKIKQEMKADVAITARILHILFSRIWDEEQVPTDWKEKLL
ncbi:unnamed protein product, partial [Schistosoma curassoni]|uniref:Endo/exonuclease/phosphatase domain-containing protein n=1 Tax=Schistosoma curassoni TaxID=6186 RepID=A0A183L5P4_9TREM